MFFLQRIYVPNLRLHEKWIKLVPRSRDQLDAYRDLDWLGVTSYAGTFKHDLCIGSYFNESALTISIYISLMHHAIGLEFSVYELIRHGMFCALISTRKPKKSFLRPKNYYFVQILIL